MGHREDSTRGMVHVIRLGFGLAEDFADMDSHRRELFLNIHSNDHRFRTKSTWLEV